MAWLVSRVCPGGTKYDAVDRQSGGTVACVDSASVTRTAWTGHTVQVALRIE